MKKLLIGTLLLTSISAFAATTDQPNTYLMNEAKGAVALAFSDATATKGCSLQLSSEDAAANIAQLVEFTMYDGTKATLAYYKTVSAAGLSQTANMRIYPGESVEEVGKKLEEVTKDVGAIELILNSCYKL
ncbi:MAG: hypothetical protein A2504_14540 [Bdellovibrionales bacterium RIFOXYD12_FULL_39_22]|nr:MAG: hypothetical protein A2385_04025 [Bdellovibrionales bacterium RIFOXYB1_FULL_39_21]OFZ43498.1 MAG: hypothetical protein A2485_13490 [Bdellovibrionales bacterium RIFOXYC12_FULL_39_17]OFZ48971.1 MAG: hypothetical protein A2404_08680 [Bdellovibrionales bacterium RIFOXYC1_FULL_39_130]OFZ73370.1 MAG: hypothetical protein A2451_04510 [Bdellovibrionales bacterium RIFOXYC2_FULL_39_8]OFZ76238.1 MAG: hypothetical protein A2560_07800 [Bdellovibrionales bacterium RIFOXYD1_FULL_39_84]OFZ94473.1 MAG: